MQLELIKTEKRIINWNYNTQKQNLVMFNRLFSSNRQTYVGSDLDVSDYYNISFTQTGFRLLGHYTEELFIKLNSLNFLDVFYFDDEANWYCSDSQIKTIIDGKELIFSLSITIHQD